MKVLLTLFSFIVMWQFACASKAELPQNSVPIDLQKEENEAQKLIDAGIKFDFTSNADGVTGEGGTYTAHGYKSSDGIKIGTQVGFYKEEENAIKCFENALKELSNTLKRESVSDKSGKIEERVVAISKETSFFRGEFLVGKRKEKGCEIYYSSSLKHLLAFEKRSDRN